MRTGSSSPPNSPGAATSRRGARSAKTRERILGVATDLMARRGYAGTTISALSRASGVLPATIYWHFESKEGLLGAVIERAADAWLEGAPGAMSHDEPHCEDTEARNRAGFHRLFEEQAEFYRVLLLVSLERRDAGGPPLAAVKRVRERVRAFMADRIEERLSLPDASLRRSVAERVAGMGMVLLDGTFLAHQIDDGGKDVLTERYEQLRATLALVKDSVVARARAESGRKAS